MPVHELWPFVAEPNLFGESSDAPGREHNTPEGGPRGKLVSPVKQAKRCVKKGAHGGNWFPP
jgi:hypothetical protein